MMPTINMIALYKTFLDGGYTARTFTESERIWNDAVTKACKLDVEAFDGFLQFIAEEILNAKPGTY